MHPHMAIHLAGEKKSSITAFYIAHAKHGRKINSRQKNDTKPPVTNDPEPAQKLPRSHTTAHSGYALAPNPVGLKLLIPPGPKSRVLQLRSTISSTFCKAARRAVYRCAGVPRPLLVLVLLARRFAEDEADEEDPVVRREGGSVGRSFCGVPAGDLTNLPRYGDLEFAPGLGDEGNGSGGGCAEWSFFPCLPLPPSLPFTLRVGVVGVYEAGGLEVRAPSVGVKHN